MGSGREHFDKARHMLKAWQHMDLGEATSTPQLPLQSACTTLASGQSPVLTSPPGWVQTNRPPISKGEKVCVAARSLFVWNRLPLEVIYTRNERTHLPRQPQLGRFPVNRRLTSADIADSKHGASGEAGCLS